MREIRICVMLTLRRVKENSGAFGGDVEKVPIQGESSGSFMVVQSIIAGLGSRSICLTVYSRQRQCEYWNV